MKYIFQLVRIRNGKPYGDTYDSLKDARQALDAYNVARDFIKAGYRRERVPAEVMLVGKPIGD